MTGLAMKTLWGRGAVVAGLGALLATYGCGRTAAVAGTQAVPAGQAAGAPVIVTCEPNQRTLVRPATVNGTAISQVECVSNDALTAAGYAQPGIAQPAPAAYGYTAPRAVRTSGYDLGDAQIVEAPRYRTAAQPVRARQVVYSDREVRVKRGRSVKKSAIIIGSSAGVGAGVGAAVGGKKGALIGAAIGGGSAAIWDQVTRRK